MCVWERKTQDFHSLLLVEAYLVPPKRLQMEELYKVESSFSEKKGRVSGRQLPGMQAFHTGTHI